MSLKTMEFESQLHEVMDIVEVLIRDSDDNQKKQLQRLATEILRVILSE